MFRYQIESTITLQTNHHTDAQVQLQTGIEVIIIVPDILVMHQVMQAHLQRMTCMMARQYITSEMDILTRTQIQSDNPV